LAKNTNLLSRLLQLTAIVFFAFAIYRLYIYFTNWVLPPEYMIYAIFAAIIVGVAILIFDDVFKPGADYVGWAFLFGVGVLALLTGLLFTFFPYYIDTNPITTIWLRAFFFLIMGFIIIIESLLIRREVEPGDNGVNADTAGPLILKFAAIFVVAWGSYQMAWVLVPFFRGVDILSMIPLLLSALGNVLFGFLLIIYVETQRRQPHFRYRRFPLLISFLLLLMILPITSFYLTIYLTLVPTLEFLFNGINGLAISLTLLFVSFYIVYHPTKAR
jgi:hypothetical protein